MVLVLTVVILQSISFANYALTTKTTNIIYGSAPYLTFDGGRTRVTTNSEASEALLRISFSDGRTFTPTTNNSSLDNPIELPVAGQSFNDIGMLVPRNTEYITLSSLIGTPYNYWGDDDGDGQGIDGITATGGLYLTIDDKDNMFAFHNEVLDICNAPYKLTLSYGGTLTTRYGVPNESRFNGGHVTYYINPNKASPVICYARPNLRYGSDEYAGPANIWNPRKGFLTQSVTPSSYGLNFPTTGAHNLYFDLDIGGVSQALSWAPVSHGGITATMTNSTSTSVRVTLTGPVATPSQWASENPGQIDRPSLPQTFELVGRDSSGNAVVKYGFVLKQWFVNRGDFYDSYPSMEWCNKIGGYRVPKVRDLTNASCRRSTRYACEDYANEVNALGGTPLSEVNNFMRHIGGGFFTEWGAASYYTGANFYYHFYQTQDRVGSGFFPVYVIGLIDIGSHARHGICVYP